MSSFTRTDVVNAASDAELPNATNAETKLLKDLMQVPPAERLDFLKAVAQQTKDDYSVNWALPTLDVTDQGVVRTDPSRIGSVMHFLNPCATAEDALHKVDIIAGSSTH